MVTRVIEDPGAFAAFLVAGAAVYGRLEAGVQEVNCPQALRHAGRSLKRPARSAGRDR